MDRCVSTRVDNKRVDDEHLEGPHGLVEPGEHFQHSAAPQRHQLARLDIDGNKKRTMEGNGCYQTMCVHESSSPEVKFNGALRFTGEARSSSANIAHPARFSIPAS